jgi:PAS domain S-box-containing protein
MRVDAARGFGYTTPMSHYEFPRSDAFLTPEVLALALESAGVAVWTIDARRQAVNLSSGLQRMMDLRGSPTIGYDEFLELIHTEDRQAVRTSIEGAISGVDGGICDVEFRSAGTAEPKWFAAHGRAVFDGGDGERACAAFVGTARDITGRKHAEAAALSEMELQRDLLHEVNHRIKNSLQLISSLLRLQAQQATDVEIRHQLEDATTRIATIAHIHERLYRDQQSRGINFGAFVSELCAELQGASSHCSLQIEAPDFFVATDKAIPLGLAINELVTNAFAYAYPDGSGTVTVSVRRGDDDQVSIAVSDRGIGLPPGFSIEGAKTLGMVLVSSMMQQLRGRLEFHDNAPGTTFIITASVTPPHASR